MGNDKLKEKIKILTTRLNFVYLFLFTDITGTIAKVTDRDFAKYENDYIIVAGGFIVAVVLFFLSDNVNQNINKLIEKLND